jgi:hypothetical protein
MKIEKLINDAYVRVASAEKNKEYYKQKDDRISENTLYEHNRYKLYIKRHGVVELIESARIGDNIDKKV